jgi:hypothetical protein
MQLRSGVSRPLQRIEAERTRENCSRQRPNRIRLRGGDSDCLKIRFGKVLGPRKHVSESGQGHLNRPAEGLYESRDCRRITRSGQAQSQHRQNRQLETVLRARHAKAGTLGNQPCEPFIARKIVSDVQQIRSKIK